MNTIIWNMGKKNAMTLCEGRTRRDDQSCVLCIFTRPIKSRQSVPVYGPGPAGMSTPGLPARPRPGDDNAWPENESYAESSHVEETPGCADLGTLASGTVDLPFLGSGIDETPLNGATQKPDRFTRLPVRLISLLLLTILLCFILISATLADSRHFRRGVSCQVR